MVDALSKMFNLNQLSGLIFIRGLSLAEVGRIEDAFAALKHGIDLCEKLEGAVHLGDFTILWVTPTARFIILKRPGNGT